MEKEIHLAATTTQEDLAAYRERKNVDSVTLLPKSLSHSQETIQ